MAERYYRQFVEFWKAEASHHNSMTQKDIDRMESSFLEQIKQQHFGILASGHMHGGLVLDRHAIPRNQQLPVHRAGAAQHLQPPAALRLQVMRDGRARWQL